MLIREGKTLVRNSSEITVGDWVTMYELDEYVYRCFVTKVLGYTSISVHCIVFYNKGKVKGKDKQFTLSLNSNSYHVYKDEEVTFDDVEDKRHLIDIALQTGDENWFRELAE